MTGRRPLDAHVSGPAAVWVLRRLDPADVRRSIAHFRVAGQSELAAALEDAYLDLHEAGRQWLATRDEDAATGLGNSVTPPEDRGASFEWVAAPGQLLSSASVSAGLGSSWRAGCSPEPRSGASGSSTATTSPASRETGG